ncbi:unnamed protein product, partial [Polarella glacialis]
MVKIDGKAFGQGAIRECFRMQEVNLETRMVSGGSGSPHSWGSGYPKASSPVHSPQHSPVVGFGAVARSLIEMRHKERRTLWVAKRSMKGYTDHEEHHRDCE